jgi:hypothetical protein
VKKEEEKPQKKQIVLLEGQGGEGVLLLGWGQTLSFSKDASAAVSIERGGKG